MSKNEISDAAIKKAQQVAQKHGLHLGDLVSHPSDEKTYQIIGIEGERATVLLKSETGLNGEQIQMEFQVGELYDPNTARQIARRMLAERNAARAKG